jgi:hypothetical protein
MSNTDYRALFKHYQDELLLCKSSITSHEVESIATSFGVIHDSIAKPIKRQLMVGDVYFYSKQGVDIEYVLIENQSDAWLVLKVSDWVDFADQYDLIITHNEGQKMIELRSGAFVKTSLVRKSLFLGNVGRQAIETIETTLKSKDRFPAKNSGKELSTEWRFIQQRFHSVEADVMQQYLHVSLSDQPIPVPLPVPDEYYDATKINRSLVSSMRTWTSATAGLGIAGLVAGNLLLNKAMPILGFASFLPGVKSIKNIANLAIEFISSTDKKKIQRIALEQINKHGLSLLYTSPWMLLWSILKTSFQGNFSYYKQPDGELILRINPDLIGRKAIIKIGEVLVFEGILKPIFSLGMAVRISEKELKSLTSITTNEAA